jgi:hypothetical protein
MVFGVDHYRDRHDTPARSALKPLAHRRNDRVGESGLPAEVEPE